MYVFEIVGVIKFVFVWMMNEMFFCLYGIVCVVCCKFDVVDMDFVVYVWWVWLVECVEYFYCLFG